jgi:hypothetical protein
MAFTIRSQPNQFISKEKKDKKWFKENIQFIMSHFNKRNDRLNRIRRAEDVENPVDEIVRMFTYYLGKQANKDYYYTTQDQNECDLPTVWINGQKVTSLIDYMVGNVIKMLDNLEPTAKITSKAAVNRRTQLLEMALLRFDMPEFFDQMEQATGSKFQPLGNQDKKFEVPEDVYRFMEYDYKENGDILATRICEDILNRNYYMEKYKQAFLYVLLGGYVGLHNRIENGKSYFETILPHNLIVDRAKDNDFLSEARFVGIVDYMATVDIIERYQEYLSIEEIEEIKKITTNNMYQLLDLTTHPYATSWAFTYNSVPMVAVVTGYWVGMKDLRYEKTTDKYGNEHYAKMRKDKKGQFWTKTVNKGILIGNRYVVDYGEDTNIVRKHDNPGDVELPVKVFMPNMTMGETRSVVSRLHKHQDRIDYITNEITKMMNRAKGKVYLINRQKLGSSTPRDVISDFERMGIHLTDGNTTGEDFVQGQDQKLVEVVDMTLDPNINLLVSLRKEEERLMEEIVNIPKVALGQQSGYVGAKTQAGTIAQSNLGTAYLYQGFIQFIEKHLSHAINQFKLTLTEEDDNEIPVVGNRGKAYLKMTKDFQFEELGVYIKVKDYIDDQARERLIGQAQAAMQNQMIDMADYIRIEQAKTYTETLAELEYSMNRKKREQAEAQAQQQAMQQQQMQQQQAAQQQMAAMKEVGQNMRQQQQMNADQQGGAPPEQGGQEMPPEQMMQ